MNSLTLKNIKPGQEACVLSIDSASPLRHRLLEMGLTPGARVLVKKTAPFGDPIEIKVRGYTLTMRLADAMSIGVSLPVIQSFAD